MCSWSMTSLQLFKYVCTALKLQYIDIVVIDIVVKYNFSSFCYFFLLYFDSGYSTKPNSKPNTDNYR